MASEVGPGERNVPVDEAEDEGAVSFGPAALRRLPETSERRSRANSREMREERSIKVLLPIWHFINIACCYV